jgi:hypothetical protein
MHSHVASFPGSVVIDQLDIDGVLTFEREHQPPIAEDLHRLLSFAVAFHRMEPIIRDIHALWPGAIVKGRQHAPELGDELRIDAACIIPREEPLQSLMSKSLDHM